MVDNVLVPTTTGPHKRSEIQIDGIVFDVLDEDAPRPWDFYEQWDEKGYYYQLFLLYRDLPPLHRSIKHLKEEYQALQERSGKEYKTEAARLEGRSWVDLRGVAFWDERALAWDEYRRLNAERLRVALDEERFKEVVESDWAEAALLRKKIAEAMPLLSAIAWGEEVAGEVRTGDDGIRERVVIKPVKLKMGLLEVARTLQALSELQRRAVGGQSPGPASSVNVAVTAEAQVQSWEARVYEVRLNEANDQLEQLKAENMRLTEELNHLRAAHGKQT